MRILSLAAAALLASACLPLCAQTMKPGLWEINNNTKGDGTDAAMAQLQQQMAQMSPQQRKQMEAALAQQGVKMGQGAGGMAVHMCFTQEMIERDDLLVQQGCKVTKNQRSGSTRHFAFTCSTPPSSGEGRVSHAGSEAYTSSMTVKTAAGETTTMATTGKWLRADCGNVKPMPVGRK
ncbi:MAG TPA: DUF3617 domain-containing protein [Ramlibacter sp.]|nr:DUF3617 domain-containing protein [Ramlibacter sp.]